jgi:HNH endonuclease
MFIRESNATVTGMVRKNGKEFPRTTTHIVYALQCDGCKREYYRDRGVAGVGIKTRKHHFCELCDQRSLSGKVAKTVRTEQCRARVGERRAGRDGYPEVYVGPDYKYARDTKYGGYYWADEHLVLIQEHLQRRLTPDEVVHHIDGDKANNELSNLVVLTTQEHNNCHGKAEQLVFELVKRGEVVFNHTTKVYQFRV